MTGKTCSIDRKMNCFLFESPPYMRKVISFACRVQRPETIDLSKMHTQRCLQERKKRFVCISLVTMAGLFLYRAAMHQVFEDRIDKVRGVM